MVVEAFDQYDRQTPSPLQTYEVVGNVIARDAIPAWIRYEGMACFVQGWIWPEVEQRYVLVGWIGNGNWKRIATQDDIPGNIVQSVSAWSNVSVTWTGTDPIVGVVNNPTFTWLITGNNGLTVSSGTTSLQGSTMNGNLV